MFELRIKLNESQARELYAQLFNRYQHIDIVLLDEQEVPIKGYSGVRPTMTVFNKGKNL